MTKKETMLSKRKKMSEDTNSTRCSSPAGIKSDQKSKRLHVQTLQPKAPEEIVWYLEDGNLMSKPMLASSWNGVVLAQNEP
jgi:hypothetical protein